MIFAERDAATVKFSIPVAVGGIEKTKSRMILEKRKAFSDGDIERDRPLARKRSLLRMLGDLEGKLTRSGPAPGFSRSPTTSGPVGGVGGSLRRRCVGALDASFAPRARL